MLADEYILNFLFAISSSFGKRNSIKLLFLTSSSLILLGFSSGLDVIYSSTAASPARCAKFMRILTIILLFALRASSQEVLIGDLVRNHDTVEIYKLIKNTDKCFSIAWKLDSIKCQPLSHASNGCIFFFHNEFGNSLIKRWYAFETFLRFSGSGEVRINSDTLRDEEYGGVYFEEGKLYLIERHRRTIISDINYMNRWEVTYEVYEGCSVKCIYSIEGDYWLMSKHFKNKADFEAWIFKRKSDVKILSASCQ